MRLKITIPLELEFDVTSSEDSIKIEKTTIKNLEIDFVKGYAVADIMVEKEKSTVQGNHLNYYDTVSA